MLFKITSTKYFERRFSDAERPFYESVGIRFEDGHIVPGQLEIKDLDELIAFAKHARPHELVLMVDGDKPQIEIYNDYRE